MPVPNVMVIFSLVVETLYLKEKCHPHGGARGKARAAPWESFAFILWGTRMSSQNVMAIQQYFSLDQSGPNSTEPQLANRNVFCVCNLSSV